MRIAVGGAVAQRAGFAGHAWVFLQYLIGLQDLGHQVFFIDQLDEPDPSVRATKSRYLADQLTRLGERVPYTVLGANDPTLESYDTALEFVRSCDLFLNFMGFIRDENILGASRRRVFVDIDPGFGQMWFELGLANIFAGHEDFVSVGERIGAADCRVPTCGIEWVGTRPPVVLRLWPNRTALTGSITTVASWRGPFGPIEYDETTYGLRVHEFRKFLPLPRLTGASFEVALDIDPADEKDRSSLLETGWRVPSPTVVAAAVDDYREFLTGSLAELMVAKNMYVETRSGWFSDRSACYLAAGTPVIAQDTGFTESIPSGEGLLAFTSLDEAAVAVEAVLRNPAAQSAAARAVAEREFCSVAVLGRLLAALGGSE